MLHEPDEGNLRLLPSLARPMPGGFNIHGLPAEIRVQIFNEYMKQRSSTDFSTPVLIKALRADPVLYHEALEAFFSLCCCSIAPENKDAVMGMPASLVRRVESLRLWYGEQLQRKENWTWGISSALPDLSILTHSNIRTLHLATNAEVLGRSGDAHRTAALDRLAALVKKCVLVLSSLSHLTLEIPFVAALPIRLGNRQARSLEIPLAAINHSLGVAHRWTVSNSPRTVNIAVSWDAGHGLLRWTDKTHRQSIPRQNFGTLLQLITRSHMVTYQIMYRTFFLGLNPKRGIRACIDPTCACMSSADFALWVPRPDEIWEGKWLKVTPVKLPELSDREKAERVIAFCVPKKCLQGLSRTARPGI
ncbi:hypothetical protein B2J93_1798 [Marssonina coronariae]|uniref:Uncharacterized protein n=1 Tax=Diplocarpon coronariae TaxID=2795749 RepID=A0A218ZD91_9HELO|nr:hypothetical protein B2J93_1798 [Marssonina coronariae]